MGKVGQTGKKIFAFVFWTIAAERDERAVRTVNGVRMETGIFAEDSVLNKDFDPA